MWGARPVWSRGSVIHDSSSSCSLSHLSWCSWSSTCVPLCRSFTISPLFVLSGDQAVLLSSSGCRRGSRPALRSRHLLLDVCLCDADWLLFSGLMSTSHSAFVFFSFLFLPDVLRVFELWSVCLWYDCLVAKSTIWIYLQASWPNLWASGSFYSLSYCCISSSSDCFVRAFTPAACCGCAVGRWQCSFCSCLHKGADIGPALLE